MTRFINYLIAVGVLGIIASLFVGLKLSKETSFSPSPTTVVSSEKLNWFTYLNPTHQIEFKYPRFYEYLEKTKAFRAYSGPEISDSSDTLETRVLLRPLNGMQYYATNWGSNGIYEFSASQDQWIYKGYPSGTSQSELADSFQLESRDAEAYGGDEDLRQSGAVPQKYTTSNGLTAWVGYNIHHSPGGEWPFWSTVYIESPDKKFVVKIIVSVQDLEHTDEPWQATDQTIYQILDTMTLGGWKLYRNDQYGFSFLLPPSWEGYSITADTWNGNDIADTTGPIISINPPQLPDESLQNIPVLVFTREQWKLVQNSSLVVSAAPIGPIKLGQNSKYVFALPPRWFSYANDIAGQIIETVKVFNPSPWKTYRNEEYGFETTIPSHWEIMEQENHISLFQRGAGAPFFDVSIRTESPRTLLEKDPLFINGFCEGNEISFAGERGLACIELPQKYPSIYQLYVQRANVTFDISTVAYEPWSQQILSTFRFTD